MTISPSAESKPMVSVIIPTYGRPAFLADAVRSVDEQSYRPVEIIVVDDCSPQPIVLEATIEAPLRVVHHARNMGPGAARNTGLAHAMGEFVLFLDDDDMLEPHRLNEGMRSIAGVRMHAAATNLGGRRFEGDMRQTLCTAPPPLVGQVLLRREDVVQFDPALRVGEDVEWWIRMRDRAIFSWSERPGLFFRAHDEKRPGVDPMVRSRCRALTADRHGPTLSRPERAYQYARAASGSLMAGQRLLTLRYSVRSLFARPSGLGARLFVRALLQRGKK